MNRTHFEHAIIALIFQGVFFLVTGSLLLGAIFAIAFFLGREISQAEYRWIKEFGQGKRANMPMLGGIDPRVWKLPEQLDAYLDFIFPTTAVMLVYFISIL